MKLWLAVLLFTYITGVYTAVVINLGREISASKGCSVTYSHGNEVHVLVGRLNKQLTQEE